MCLSSRRCWLNMPLMVFTPGAFNVLSCTVPPFLPPRRPEAAAILIKNRFAKQLKNKKENKKENKKYAENLRMDKVRDHHHCVFVLEKQIHTKFLLVQLLFIHWLFCHLSWRFFDVAFVFLSTQVMSGDEEPIVSALLAPQQRDHYFLQARKLALCIEHATSHLSKISLPSSSTSASSTSASSTSASTSFPDEFDGEDQSQVEEAEIRAQDTEDDEADEQVDIQSSGPKKADPVTNAQLLPPLIAASLDLDDSPSNQRQDTSDDDDAGHDGRKTDQPAPREGTGPNLPQQLLRTQLRDLRQEIG